MTLGLAPNRPAQHAHVTHIGDTTFGAFSDNPKRELPIPNGWVYAISSGDFSAADGKSYEGVGITTAQRVVNTRNDIAADQDIVLARAVELRVK